MTFLIAPSELLKALEKYEAAEAAKAAPAPSGYKYVPRTRTQLEIRCNQTSERPRTLSKVAREWAQRAEDAKKIATGSPQERELDPQPMPSIPETAVAQPPVKEKVSGKTKCVCGHRKDGHCTGQPKLHTPEGETPFWCEFEHCENSTWDGEQMRPCDCPAFRTSETDVPKQKVKKADDFTPCGNCSHWRSHHCKVRRPSKAKNPRKREATKWTGFEDENGECFQCKHTLPDGADYRCTSASCATNVGSDEAPVFCPCEKFVNPLARPRQSKKKKGKRDD
jgi:hypothetical protein